MNRIRTGGPGFVVELWVPPVGGTAFEFEFPGAGGPAFETVLNFRVAHLSRRAGGAAFASAVASRRY